MLEEGLLADGDVDRAVALHIYTRFPAGVVAFRPGPMLASADRIAATVRGRGGHASTPHLALDPITVAAIRSADASIGPGRRATTPAGKRV